MADRAEITGVRAIPGPDVSAMTVGQLAKPCQKQLSPKEIRNDVGVRCLGVG